MAKEWNQLADALVAAAKASEGRPRNGIQPWYRRLPPDRLAELEDIRDRYERGEFGRLTQCEAANAIMLWGAEHGLDIPKRWTVVRWLTRKP